MNKQQLARRIWRAANKMRSKIEASEYKDYILGFIFYRFLSEQEERFCLSEKWTHEDLEQDLNEDNTEDAEHIRNNLGYFISYQNLYSTWLASGSDFSVDNVRIALSAFSRNISPNCIMPPEKRTAPRARMTLGPVFFKSTPLTIPPAA